MMMVMMSSFAKIIMTIINLKGRDDHDDGHDEFFCKDRHYHHQFGRRKLR